MHSDVSDLPVNQSVIHHLSTNQSINPRLKPQHLLNIQQLPAVRTEIVTEIAGVKVTSVKHANTRLPFSGMLKI
jgi:hypothetical protein